MRVKNNENIISIIIPMYNCEKYIERLIESLYNQTIKNFELIFINDGSTDNSLDICRNTVRNKNINYKIINQENSGVSVARNKGITEASGEYLYFLDADDYIENNFCEVIINTFTKYDIDMIMFNYNTIDNGKRKYNCDIENYDYIIEKSSKQILEDILMNKIPYHVCSFVVKKNVIDRNKLRFTINSKYGEDHEFLIKAASISQKIIVIKNRLYNYCKNEFSVTTKFNINRIDSIASALRVKDYLNKSYCNIHLNNLANKYICNKLMYNIDQYVKFYDENNKELGNIFMDYIYLNKKYFRFYSYNEKKISIKKRLKSIILSIFPKVYIKL